jgi:hypothetical protein
MVIGAVVAEIPVELQPLTDVLQPLLLKASVLVGGIFGLYLILIFVRIHYERKKVKLLQDIRFDLDKANMHQGVSFSKQRPTLLKRFFGIFRRKYKPPKEQE